MRATETVAKGVEAARRGVEETASAFIAWKAKYDVDVKNREDARMKLRMPDGLSVNELRRRVQRGYQP